MVKRLSSVLSKIVEWQKVEIVKNNLRTYRALKLPVKEGGALEAL